MLKGIIKIHLPKYVFIFLRLDGQFTDVLFKNHSASSFYMLSIYLLYMANITKILL